MNYWEEALDCALDEAGCYEALTTEQRSAVAKSLEFAADMKGEATGSISVSNPIVAENERLKRELDEERDRVRCPECGGKGKWLIAGRNPGMETCWKCHGERFVLRKDSRL